MEELKLLRDKLMQGFYVDNLYEMSSLCTKLSSRPDMRVPMFVLSVIFRGIAADWDERPIEVEYARDIEMKLLAPVKAMIEAIEDKKRPHEIYVLLDGLIQEFLHTVS